MHFLRRSYPCYAASCNSYFRRCSYGYQLPVISIKMSGALKGFYETILELR